MRRHLLVFTFVTSFPVAAPVMAFTAEECTESYIAEGLPADARAAALPDYFIEPGQLGTNLVCTLVPSDTYGTIIQVSAPVPDDPNAAFLQYFPDYVQVLRTEGAAAGLALTVCGPIPESVPPEQNPGGVWCQIDIALGRGVTFDLEYDTVGELAWLNFEVAARDDGILAGSTLAPVFADTEPDDLRAGVFLPSQDTTHLLRYIPPAGAFRMAEPQAIIDLFYALRDGPQDLTFVVETGDPEAGPFAQVDLSADVLEEIMAELALVERLFRTDRGL